MIYGILTKPARGVRASRLVTLGSSVNGQPDPAHSYPEYLEYVVAEHDGPLAPREPVRAVHADAADREFRLPRRARHEQLLRDTRRAAGSRPGIHRRRKPAGRLRLVAVVSYRVWQEQFHGADDIIGQAVVLNGHPATVIGVAPPASRARGSPTRRRCGCRSSPIRGWPDRSAARRRVLRSLNVIGQLAPGASLGGGAKRVPRDLGTAGSGGSGHESRQDGRRSCRYSVTAGGNSIARPSAVRCSSPSFRSSRCSPWSSCAPTSRISCSRAPPCASGKRPCDIRWARRVSASCARCSSKDLLISLAAWAGACLFAVWTSRPSSALLPPAAQGSAFPLDFTPDWRVVSYAMGLALVATIAFTLPPALRAWRQDVLPWLKAGEQGIIQGRSRLSGTLVDRAARVGRAAAHERRTRVSFDVAHQRTQSGIRDRSTWCSQPSARPAPRRTSDANRALLERLRERLRSAPGVRSVSYARSVPSMPGPSLAAGSGADQRRRDAVARLGQRVGPDYLRVLGLSPSPAGSSRRTIARAGRASAIINQDLADDAVAGPAGGRSHPAAAAGPTPVEVVGVTPNALFSGYGNETRPNFVFLSQQQEPRAAWRDDFYVRSAGHARGDRAGASVARSGRRARVSRSSTCARSTASCIRTPGRSGSLRCCSILFAAGSLVDRGDRSVRGHRVRHEAAHARFRHSHRARRIVSTDCRRGDPGGLRWTAVGPG